MKPSNWFLVVVLGLLVIKGFTQNVPDNVIYLNGYLKDNDTGKRIPGGIVRVVSSNGDSLDIQVSSAGRFDMHFDFGNSYMIYFASNGYITKCLIVDGRNVPPEKQLGGMGFDIDITLFKPRPGVDYSIFAKPIAIAEYDQNKGELLFNLEYNKQISSEILEWEKQVKKSRSN